VPSLTALRKHLALPLSLAAGTLLFFALLLLRFRLAGSREYLWLVWNLFLAWIPYGVALLLDWAPRRPAWLTALLGLVWLLFFPNAPYLLTDIIHLTWVPAPDIWFDIALIAYTALLGLFLAFASMQLIHRAVTNARGAAAGWLFAIAVWWLCALGMYLGRVPRWNSWDVIHAPLLIVRDALVLLGQPGPQLFIATFALVLNAGYLIYYTSSAKNGPG
jgi:uncharacterized membrane protein